jgi:hypothetical protein
MLRFECRSLEHGTLMATIADRERSVDLLASFISDGLGDLVRAVIGLLLWQNQTRAVWAEEPGEYRWVLTRSDEMVAIRVLWFTDTFSYLADERGEPVFSTTARLVDLAGQVTSQLRALLERLGEDGYQEQWSYPFPRTEYETLLRLRRERRLHNFPDS